MPWYPGSRHRSLKHVKRPNRHKQRVFKLRHSPGAKRQRDSSRMVWLSPDLQKHTFEGDLLVFIQNIIIVVIFFVFTLDIIYNNKHSLNKSLPNTATPSGMKFRICHHLQQTLQYIQQNKYIVVNSGEKNKQTKNIDIYNKKNNQVRSSGEERISWHKLK